MLFFGEVPLPYDFVDNKVVLQWEKLDTSDRCTEFHRVSTSTAILILLEQGCISTYTGFHTNADTFASLLPMLEPEPRVFTRHQAKSAKTLT